MEDKTKTRLLLLHACDDVISELREESHEKHVFQMLDQLKLEEEQIYWHGRDPFTTFNALTKAHEKIYHRVYLAQLDGQAIALRDLLKKHGYVDGAGQSDPIDAVLYRTLDVLQNRLTYAQVREKVINIIKNAYADQQYNAYSTAYMCAACRQALSTFRSTASDNDARVNDLCNDIERVLDGRGIVGLVSNVIEELESKVTEGAKARETETPGDKSIEARHRALACHCNSVLAELSNHPYESQIQQMIDATKKEMSGYINDKTLDMSLTSLLLRNTTRHELKRQLPMLDGQVDECIESLYTSLGTLVPDELPDDLTSPFRDLLRDVNTFLAERTSYAELKSQVDSIIKESRVAFTTMECAGAYIITELRKLQAKLALKDDEVDVLCQRIANIL